MEDDVSEAQLDPVTEALHNLKLRRDELDRAIIALERIRPSGELLRRTYQGAHSLEDGQGDFGLAGMTLAGAIVTVLRSAGRPLANSEIVSLLRQGGMRFRGVNPPLAVAQALSRLSQKEGPIQKLGRGQWNASLSPTIAFESNVMQAAQ